MSRTDIREISPGCFQIVMDPGCARRLHPLKLLLCKKPKGYAYFYLYPCLYLPDGIAHRIHFRIIQCPARGNNRIPEHAPFRIIPGLTYKLFLIKKRIFLRSCVVICRLGAVSAVFRTSAALPINDRADIKCITAEMPPYLIRRPAKLLQRSLIQCGRLFLGYPLFS